LKLLFFNFSPKKQVLLQLVSTETMQSNLSADIF